MAVQVLSYLSVRSTAGVQSSDAGGFSMYTALSK